MRSEPRHGAIVAMSVAAVVVVTFVSVCVQPLGKSARVSTRDFGSPPPDAPAVTSPTAPPANIAEANTTPDEPPRTHQPAGRPSSCGRHRLKWPLGEEPTVNRDRHPVEIAGGFGEEEGHHSGDVFGHCHPAQGNPGADCLDGTGV